MTIAREDRPNRESLMAALRVVGRTSDGQLIPEVELRRIAQLQEAQIVGILDAAVERLAQSYSRGVGKGNSQRHLVINGYMLYQEMSGQERDLLGFLQSRLDRAVGDMPVDRGALQEIRGLG
jgi:hypothetical protein